jgi:hypothetical protein
LIFFPLDSHPVSLPAQPIVSNNNKIFPSTTTSSINPSDTTKNPLPSTLDTVTKPLSVTEEKNDNAINDNLTTLITEQRRQNRLLEQVIAAINTTNALLTQLVQR